MRGHRRFSLKASQDETVRGRVPLEIDWISAQSSWSQARFLLELRYGIHDHT
jgi:hypothetical protein